MSFLNNSYYLNKDLIFVFMNKKKNKLNLKQINPFKDEKN